MKNVLISILAIFLLSACNNKDTESYDVPTPSFAKGADVSWLSEMEKDGKTFRKNDGSKADCFEVLKDCGVNAIRLRVWVNPTGGWSGKDDMIGLAVRAAKAGMAVMVDFHYSDFFCDPSRQNIPKQWEADKADLNKMVAHVKEHTTEVLQALATAGVTPAWIQIGNETRNGFLWPSGKLWATSGETVGGKDAFNTLFKAGYGAAKEVFPSALVGPHLNNAYADNDWWFKDRKDGGCKFDMICLSHYPQAESKMTPAEYNSAAISRMKSLNSTYNVPVIISEVGVKTPADEGVAASVLREFMTEVKKLSFCSGVFYWEPEVYDWWKPSVYNSLGWGSYDMGAFLSGGRPSSVMTALCE
jgi:arabinogalactan endo-1,4-beta-galactosidase